MAVQREYKQLKMFHEIALKSGFRWELTELTVICLNPMAGSIMQFADVELLTSGGDYSSPHFIL